MEPALADCGTFKKAKLKKKRYSGLQHIVKESDIQQMLVDRARLCDVANEFSFTAKV